MTELEASDLRTRRELWLEAVTGDDINSVFRQLLRLGMDLATFEMVNEARRRTHAAESGSVQANGLFHELFDRAFVAAAITAIRRQCDSESLEGHRGVFGLVPVIDDMIGHAESFTRAGVLEAEGLPYEYEDEQKRELDDLMEKYVPGVDVNVPIRSWRWSEIRHKHLDWACDVGADKRSPADLCDQRILQLVRDRVKSAGAAAVDYANKFIAHAATPESRARVDADELMISLQYLTEAHRVLCESAAFISVEVLHGSCPAFLPTVAFNPAQYLDRPLVQSSDLVKLAQIWEQRWDAGEEYARSGRRELQRELDLTASTTAPKSS